MLTYHPDFTIYQVAINRNLWEDNKKESLFFRINSPAQKQRNPEELNLRGFLKTAATYSPTMQRSTIGASGLNFSVRNGKRWNPTAITT